MNKQYVLVWTHRHGSETRIIESERENLNIQDVLENLDQLQIDDYEGEGRTDREQPREDEGLELFGPLVPITLKERRCRSL